jgi:hypothetical protein
MARFIVVLVLTLFAGVFASLSAQTNARQVTKFKFDWDAYKDVQVVLEIPASWSEPGDFTRIRIRVPKQKEFRLSNKLGWVQYGSDEASKSKELLSATNLVSSKYVLALKADKHRTLLFLFGYSYASSPGSLDVLELGDSGQPRVVFHRDEFGLKDVRDLDGDGIQELIGYPCLSEAFGDGLLSYAPFNVYMFGAASSSSAKLSLPLSKAYNLKHYYGWAGAVCSEKFAVVLHPPKGEKPLVMNTQAAEKLTSR